MAHDVYVKWTYTFNVHWSWIMNLTCLCRLHMHLSNEQFVHLAWILFIYSFNIVMSKMQIISGFDIRKLIRHVCANLNMWMSNKQIVIWHLEVYSRSLYQIAHVNVEWSNCDLTLGSLFDKFMSNCRCECRMNTLFVFMTSSAMAISISKSMWVLDLQSPSTASIHDSLNSWLW